jgi:MoaA/NifB/PqqE/SkfB family radical SAM enzyme
MTSKTYCPLPFMHLNIGPRSSVTPCCHFDEKVDDTSANVFEIPLKDINKSPQWYKIQKQLISEKKPLGCHKCYEDEENGIKSQRQTAIERFGDGITDREIKSLELKLGAKCNLACRTCSSDSSNKWLKEESLMWFGHINKEWIKQKQSLSGWTGNEKFWNDLHDISHNLEKITFTGGEPMLIDEHFKYLEWLSYNGYKPQLDYITNGTIPLAKTQKILDKFDNITMTLSIDAVGRLSNYIRTGSDWETLEHNIRDYAKYFNSRGHHLDLSATVSVLNVSRIGKLARLADVVNIKFDLNFLRHPSWMSILNLSEHSREYVVNEISKLDGYISTKNMKKMYDIVKFFNTENNAELDDMPIWRHILQREMRYNKVNTNNIALSKVDPEWWDILILEN